MAAVLALTALGLSLVFGVMRVVNVAHGEFFMLGAVVAWFVADAGRRRPRRSASSPRSSSARSSSAPSRSPPTGWSCAASTTSPRRRSSPRSASLYILQQVALSPLRPRGAAGRRRRSASASSSPGSAIPATSSPSSRFAALVLAAIWLLLDPHPHRPRHARDPVRPRDRARLRHRRRPGLCRRLRARRRARGGRRRADRADQPGALPDGRRPAAALLHRRHHRRARLLPRHHGRRAPDRALRRHHLGLLLADAGQDPRHAARRAGAGVPPAGPVRHGAPR